MSSDTGCWRTCIIIVGGTTSSRKPVGGLLNLSFSSWPLPSTPVFFVVLEQSWDKNGYRRGLWQKSSSITFPLDVTLLFIVGVEGEHSKAHSDQFTTDFAGKTELDSGFDMQNQVVHGWLTYSVLCDTFRLVLPKDVDRIPGSVRPTPCILLLQPHLA